MAESSSAFGPKLVAWAASHGCCVSRSVSFLELQRSGDRTCRAIASISEDELLVQVPRSLAFELCAKTGRGPLGSPQKLLERLHPKLSERGTFPAGKNIVTALLLHFERSRGGETAFGPYLASLPSSFPTMPLADGQPPWYASADRAGNGGVSEALGDEAWMYKGTGVDLLMRSGAALSGREGIARMRQVIDEVDPGREFWPQHVEERSLKWAAAVVQSRAHASKAGGTMLIPLADAFNHSASCANCEVVEHEDKLEVRAAEPIASGDELLLSYGHFSNAELLFNAGFTCVPNEHDCLLVSPPGLLAAAKQRWRCRGSSPPVDLEKRSKALFGNAPPPRLSASAPLLGRGVPAKVVTLLAGLALDENEWQRLVAEDGSSGVVHELWTADSPQATTLRAEVLASVALALRGAVAHRYAATSLPSDQKELTDADDRWKSAMAAEESCGESSAQEKLIKLQRRVNILRVRVGERNLLARLDAAIVARTVAGAAEDRRAVAENVAKRSRLEEAALANKT